MNTHAPVTREQLAELVHRLSPSRADTTRNEWVKVGQAIHDADSGDYGFALFEQFSRQSPKFNPANFRSTWKSFTPGRGITVGSLIHFGRWADSGAAVSAEFGASREGRGGSE
jgi:hypothetical protein